MEYKKYRIVADDFAGYECQCWRLWWPFWIEMNGTNTHSSLDAAKKYIEKYSTIYWQSDNNINNEKN